MNKDELRQIYRSRRQDISPTRRSIAELTAMNQIQSRIEKGRFVLSYASKGDELDTSGMNAMLALENQLVLPKVVGNELKLYQVSCMSTDCLPNSWGIPEPIEEKCIEISPQQISLAIVPGLVFDPNRFRIGYGLGFYDRFLPHLTKGTPTIGLGFIEQLTETPLPTEDHDVPLQELMLV